MTEEHKNHPDQEATALADNQPEMEVQAGATRSDILQILLNQALPFLAILFVLGISHSLLSRNWLVAGIETVLFLLAALLTFARSGAERVRAAGYLVVLFSASLLALILAPFSGLSQLLLVAGVYGITVIFGLPAALLYTFLGAAMIAAVGYSLLMGYLPLAAAAAPGPVTLLFWLAAGLSFMFAGMLIASVQQRVQLHWQKLFAALKFEKSEIEIERDSLIADRTDLEKRLVQLRTVADISRVSNTVNDPQALMQQVVTLIQDRFDLYYAGIFLLDENKEFAVLKAGSGQPGNQMVDSNHRLPVGGSSMVGWAAANAQARIALDTGAESIRFENPLLPNTRSELALPLSSGKQVIGALSIQSEEPNAFDGNDLTVLQGLADALTVAIQNAQRYQEVQAHLKEIQALNRQYLISAWHGQLEHSDSLEYSYQDRSSPADLPGGEIFQSNLMIRDQVIGSLVVESGTQAWTEEEISLIEAVASQASQALENARLLRESQNKAYQEQLISDFSSNIRETFNLDAILRTAVRELGDRLNLAEVEAHIGWNDQQPVNSHLPEGN